MKLKAISIAVAALGVGVAGAAQATVLLPGGGPLAVDIVASAPGGTILDTASGTLSTPHWTGTYRTAVVDGPEAGVNLDFYYQVTNGSGSTDSLGRITGADFNNAFITNLIQTNAAFDGFVAGGQSAFSGDRDMFGVVGFNFLPGTSGTGKIDPGESSYLLIIRTNATSYTAGTMAVINGTATFASAFQPSGQPPLVGPIPEPGTMALLATGLLAIGGVARKRRL
ncbi:MAG: PEP-CTERM sorting domain-containing protein [Rhodospirillaceae bacterium]